MRDVKRRRRRQRFVLNRRWSIGLTASIGGVILGIIGISVLTRPWLYAALAIAILGAITALIQTIARGAAGDQVD